jgi:hypothetical protein
MSPIWDKSYQELVLSGLGFCPIGWTKLSSPWGDEVLSLGAELMDGLLK